MQTFVLAPIIILSIMLTLLSLSLSYENIYYPILPAWQIIYLLSWHNMKQSSSLYNVALGTTFTNFNFIESFVLSE